MTTSVSIINNGPDKVRVAAINDRGQIGVGTVTLAPSERHDMYVYPGNDVQVREVREEELQRAEQPAGDSDPDPIVDQAAQQVAEVDAVLAGGGQAAPGEASEETTNAQS